MTDLLLHAALTASAFAAGYTIGWIVRDNEAQKQLDRIRKYWK